MYNIMFIFLTPDIRFLEIEAIICRLFLRKIYFKVKPPFYVSNQVLENNQPCVILLSLGIWDDN